MIVFSLLLLLLTPLINYIFFNKKHTSVFIISTPYLMFNILSSFLVGMLDLKYYVVMPIFITFFICLILAFFVICFLKQHKNKEILKKTSVINSFYKYLPILIGSILFFLIIIFVNSYFPDTQAYLSASIDYMNGIEPSFHDGGNIDIYYKVMPQIITYSTLFGKDAAVAYYILTPYVMFLMYSSIINEWFIKTDIKIKSIRYFLIVVSIATLGIITPFLSSFMTSGNIFPQSLILLITFFSLFKEKDNQWKTILTLAITQFYSPTGYINALLISICVLLFVAIYSTIKNLLLTIATMPLLSFLPTYLFHNVFGCFRQIIFALVFVWLIAVLSIYFYKKNVIINANNKLNNIYNKNWFQYTQYSLFILIGLMVTVVFYFVYKKNYLYTKELSFLTPIFFIFITTFGLIQFIKKNKITKIPTFFLLASTMSMVFLAFSIISQKDNNSTWRIIYLNFGMGGPIDIIMLFILVCNKISIDFEFHKSLKIKKIELKVKEILLISTTLCMSFVGLGFGVYNTVPTSVRLFSTSSNVVQNIFKISNKDKNELMKINDIEYKVFCDVQVNYILTKANNSSGVFFNDFEIGGKNQHDVSDWTISAYSLYGPINIIDSKLENKNQKIIDRITQMIANNDINSLILDKNTIYYNDLFNAIKSQFQSVYLGEGLTILKL